MNFAITLRRILLLVYFYEWVTEEAFTSLHLLVDHLQVKLFFFFFSLYFTLLTECSEICAKTVLKWSEFLKIDRLMIYFKWKMLLLHSVLNVTVTAIIQDFCFCHICISRFSVLPANLWYLIMEAVFSPTYLPPCSLKPVHLWSTQNWVATLLIHLEATSDLCSFFREVGLRKYSIGWLYRMWNGSRNKKNIFLRQNFLRW